MKKVTVNKDVCIGCGACMHIAGDVFGYDESGLSKVKIDSVPDDNDKVVMAAESCPTGAIKVENGAKTKEDNCDGDCNCEDDCDCGEECTCDHECGCHKN